MLFIVRFTDEPERLAVRQDHMQSHPEWLERNKDAVLQAGSLRVEPDAAPVGAHWIVEAANRDAVSNWSDQVPSGFKACGRRLRSFIGRKRFRDVKGIERPWPRKGIIQSSPAVFLSGLPGSGLLVNRSRVTEPLQV
jgi:uncharacterized protein YciI